MSDDGPRSGGVDRAEPDPCDRTASDFDDFEAPRMGNRA